MARTWLSWDNRAQPERLLPTHNRLSWMCTHSSAEVARCTSSESPDKEIMYSNDRGQSASLVSLLKAFNSADDCMIIHHRIIEGGLESNLLVVSHLLHVYLRCKHQEDGLALFSSMNDRTVYFWNYLIQDYAKKPGDDLKPFNHFYRMQEESVLPNRITFLSVISSQLVQGQVERMHARVILSEHGRDIVIGTALIKQYGHINQLEDALSIFNRMPWRDVVIWTTLIMCYAQQGHIEGSLLLLHQMQEDVAKPNNITYISVLAEYAKYGGLKEGRVVHNYVFIGGFDFDIAVNNALINMYGRCGDLHDAGALFDRICDRNIVTWTTMIMMHTQKHHSKSFAD